MRSILTLLFVLLSGPAFAKDPVLKSGFQECISQSIDANTPVIECVSEAHAQCTAYEPGSPAELVCYRSAKSEWGVLLKDLLASFSDQPEDLQEVVRIEAKYTLLRNLMNCDLANELSLIGRDADPQDQLRHAKCEALASAASLTEVLIKSGTVVRN